VLLTVVDAFTDQPFRGNPAAVALVDRFPPDERMQLIAREMNLSETAFVVPRADGGYELRWFTPTTEVDLCGHATLAAAHVLNSTTVFHTPSGNLPVGVRRGSIEMDFPAMVAEQCSLPALPEGFAAALWTGTAGDDWLIEFPSCRAIANLVPDQLEIAALGRRGVIVTAPAEAGSGVDIVSRVFAPNVGIAEDPVTGSAHCALAPFWAPRFGREGLTGYQASARGGTVGMRLAGDRVTLVGQAVTVSQVNLLA
jgi:predicted PhzF superfamily epimerase YddE/YHI9